LKARQLLNQPTSQHWRSKRQFVWSNELSIEPPGPELPTISAFPSTRVKWLGKKQASGAGRIVTETNPSKTPPTWCLTYRLLQKQRQESRPASSKSLNPQFIIIFQHFRESCSILENPNTLLI